MTTNLHNAILGATSQGVTLKFKRNAFGLLIDGEREINGRVLAYARLITAKDDMTEAALVHNIETVTATLGANG